MRFLTFLAKRFVAGDVAEEAIQAARRINSEGAKATLCFLGEDCDDLKAAQQAAQEYAHLLELIGNQSGSSRSWIDSNVSLKLTQLGLGFNGGACRDHMKRLLEAAREHGNFIRIDMEGSAYTEKIVRLFGRLYREFPNVGVVIQAYLRSSSDHVRKLNALGARVRLCKGAYKEPPAVAFQTKEDVNRSFDQLAGELLLNGNYPAFATHDPERIEHVLRFAEEHSIPKEKFEFQMLYGLGHRLWKGLADRGYNVRIYIPYGTRWFPYFYRRLRERKENVFFVLRSLFS